MSPGEIADCLAAGGEFTVVGSGSRLMVSVTGPQRVHHSLEERTFDVHEPVWGPIVPVLRDGAYVATREPVWAIDPDTGDMHVDDEGRPRQKMAVRIESEVVAVESMAPGFEVLLSEPEMKALFSALALGLESGAPDAPDLDAPAPDPHPEKTQEEAARRFEHFKAELEALDFRKLKSRALAKGVTYKGRPTANNIRKAFLDWYAAEYGV